MFQFRWDTAEQAWCFGWLAVQISRAVMGKRNRSTKEGSERMHSRVKVT